MRSAPRYSVRRLKANKHKVRKLKRKRLIAVTGKGGTGKTIFTAIMTKLLTKDKKFKILVIDADPAMGLRSALGVEVNKTIGQIREEIIKSAKSKREEKIWITRMLDYDILKALGEGDGFGLLVMGRQQSAGCFCPANALLKDAIQSLSKSFDILLIDCEAGLEQINREVIRPVGTLVIITDLTMRGVQTAAAIERSARKFTKADKMGLVINRVKEGEEKTVQNLSRHARLEILGSIPEDRNITEWDLLGKPIIDLPDTLPSVRAIHQIMKKII